MKSVMEEMKKHTQVINDLIRSPVLEVMGENADMMNDFHSSVMAMMKEHARSMEYLTRSPAVEVIREHVRRMEFINKPALGASVAVQSIKDITSLPAMEIATSITQGMRGLPNPVAISAIETDVKKISSAVAEVFKGIDMKLFADYINTRTLEELLESDFEEDFTGIDKQAERKRTNEVSLINVNIYFQQSTKKPSKKERFMGFLLKSIIAYAGGELAKEVMLCIVLLLLPAAQNYDHHVLTRLQDIVESKKENSDFRKLFSKDSTLPKPISQMGYMRKEAFLRKGPRKGAPISDLQKVKENNVVFLLERKENWVKVYYEGSDSAGSGWVEESKVIKFKVE